MRGGRLDQYELLEVIGHGEILTLYRAHDTERDRSVILELIQSDRPDDPGLIARFQHRAEELLRLRHPHIVPALDGSFGEHALYLVTDVPDGEALESRRAGFGRLEVDDVLAVVSQVAQALDYAHEQGVFHHDLRPANIYLKDKSAVLTGFYLLEAIGANPVYMAPEQLDETSAETPDRRSDVYALGVIIYEMLTGRPPFEGPPADVAAAHVTQRPLPPRIHNPDLFPALDAILLKTLAKEPKGRYESAGALVAILHEAVQTAQTRKMANGGLFDSEARTGEGTVYQPRSAFSLGGIPVWGWVGLGIALVVALAVAVLLATG